MTLKSFYAKKFGLPIEQIRFFGELTEEQKECATYQFGTGRAGYDAYIYAIKQSGGLVPRREKRDLLTEAQTTGETNAR